MKIIRQIGTLALDYLGKMDILIAGERILAVEGQPEGGYEGVEVEELPGEGRVLIPGFIDCHFHTLGGGGEGGYQSRTPGVTLSQLTTAGVATAVGCLGTGEEGRDMAVLISKTKGLRAEGVSTYTYEGSCRLPVKTVTDSIIKDFLAIDKVVGIGEIAVSDHRSSQPSFEEFTRVAADAHIGGMLSGRAGIINARLGGEKRKPELLTRIVEETEIPIIQFSPIHTNRTPELFEACMVLAERGDVIDFTANKDPDFRGKTDGEIRSSKTLEQLTEEGVSLDNFTMTSDEQGNLSYFDENNHFLGLGVGSAEASLVGIKEAVQKENIPPKITLRIITGDPAHVLKLDKKGKIETDADADLCILDKETLDIDTVIARGGIMIQEKEVEVWGTFEKSF